jgi:hypothetical protein
VWRIQSEHPGADVEVWSEDEHRIGLHPIVRRIWVELGEQPVATVNWKRQWLWLYAFVQPQTGQTYWWLLPYVNTKLFSRSPSALSKIASAATTHSRINILSLVTRGSSSRLIMGI